MKYYNSLNDGDLFQFLILSFHDIYHPQRLLDNDEIAKLVNYIIVGKLYYENSFLIGVFFRNELKQIIKQHVV